MRLLLDTHVVIWALADSPELKRDIRQKIANPLNQAFISAASVWEIVIKQSLGKLDAPDDLLEAIQACNLSTLPVTAGHAFTAGRLPRHHDDPFDRMLVAQAQIDNLALITNDRRLSAYQVQILSA